MSGLLWSAVKAGDIELSANSERMLAWRELLTRHHHRKLWEAMEDLSGRFHQAGLGVATLKGVTAEARWYERMGERPSLDVDLLVSPTDLDRLEECAALIQPDHPLRGQLDEAVGRGGLQSLDLWGPGQVAIDLHFDPLKLGIPTLQADLVWSRSVPYPTPNGVEIRVLDAETSLILFLFHVLKDRFSSLIGLVDIVRIVEHEDLHWDYIDRFVRTEGLEVPAYLTLDAVFGALRLDAPAVPAVSGWREQAWQRLWPDDSAGVLDLSV